MIAIISITCVVLMGALGSAFYYLGNHATPQPQEALSDLNLQTLDSFKDRFNRDADQLRVILLLSPT
jgi:hypothetical protein